MAFRSIGYLKQLANSLRGKATYATSTQPKLKSFAPMADLGYARDVKEPKKVKGDIVVVYVAIGLIALSSSLGLYTALPELRTSPQVRVNKKRRETLPEVEEPDRVLDEAGKYIRQSFFRKVAHFKDNDDGHGFRDPSRGDIFANGPLLRAETLESAGVNPKFRVLDG